MIWTKKGVSRKTNYYLHEGRKTLVWPLLIETSGVKRAAGCSTKSNEEEYMAQQKWKEGNVRV